MKVAPCDADLATFMKDEVEQLRTAFPKRRIELATSGDTRGWWDGPRLQQVLRNLVSNAARYGSRDTPIKVTLRGEKREVFLEVENAGTAIGAEWLEEMFEPLKRGAAPEEPPDRDAGLGLGLFIVREITRAHGGEVVARSHEGVTTFVVRLPREASRA